MANLTLPEIQSLPSCSTTERAQVLDLLFEPSTQLHTLSVELLGQKTFESYQDLIASVGVQLVDLGQSSSTSDQQWLDDILQSHPRLGEKHVDSAQSQAEQAQLKSGNVEEQHQLAALNAEYEKTFPGLRYVVFVNGRPRPEIMDDMRSRIKRGSIELERSEAIKAMCDIAADRAMKLNKL